MKINSYIAVFFAILLASCTIVDKKPTTCKDECLSRYNICMDSDAVSRNPNSVVGRSQDCKETLKTCWSSCRLYIKPANITQDEKK